jgi:hypothetical protein
MSRKSVTERGESGAGHIQSGVAEAAREDEGKMSLRCEGSGGPQGDRPSPDRTAEKNPEEISKAVKEKSNRQAYRAAR